MVYQQAELAANREIIAYKRLPPLQGYGLVEFFGSGTPVVPLPLAYFFLSPFPGHKVSRQSKPISLHSLPLTISLRPHPVLGRWESCIPTKMQGTAWWCVVPSLSISGAHTSGERTRRMRTGLLVMQQADARSR